MSERDFDARVARWGCGIGAVAILLACLAVALGEGITGESWNSATFAIFALILTIAAFALLIALVFAIVWLGRWLLQSDEDESPISRL